MSRFTSMNHPPKPFEFPRPLISPPETHNSDIFGSTPGHGSPAHPHAMGGRDIRLHEIEGLPVSSSSADTSSRFRRGSSIAYQNSGLRESRSGPSQRTTKAFIVVVPPATLIQEHGQLGHTLSSGPVHRLSQGILMPLFPTMYSQLTAIAREFNFPSTAGLCLYLHFTDGGITMTPRISDESWPIIWSHILEPVSSPSGHKSPISGKVEFDIDRRIARWYPSWVLSSHRDTLDVPVSVNHSPGPSLGHFRGDSRTTIADGFDVDDHTDDMSTSHHPLAPVARRVPRKLSLVDRFETMSSRSASRPVSRSGLSPPEQSAAAIQTLSPIFQEDEPKTATGALENRVNIWRAGAVLQPTPLAAKGQISLEPPNMPNSLDIVDNLVNPGDELNLEDFTWSVSSEGPGDYDYDVLAYDTDIPYRLPSPDMAHRMYEDCPPTPSTATSWGAPLSYPSTPMSYQRAASVDLAYRVGNSRPVTPSTVTSWGPSDASYSPTSESSSFSVHIAHRGEFSRPTTPLTSTSWGVSDAQWPDSPNDYYHGPPSVHLDARGDFSRPVTPSTATSWGAPLSYPATPATPFFVHTPDAGQRAFDESRPVQFESQTPTLEVDREGLVDVGEAVAGSSIVLQAAPTQSRSLQQSGPWTQVWPYRNAGAPPKVETSSLPWNQVWPYRSSSASASSEDQSSKKSAPWNQVWPYRTSSASASAEEQTSQKSAPWNHLWPYRSAPSVPTETSKSSPWNQVWPYRATSNLSQELPVKSSPWNQVWPYRAAPSPASHGTGSIHSHHDRGYPYFNLYPAVYPHFDLYPSAHIIIEKPLLDCSPEFGNPLAGYPTFNLYPAVYPHNLLAIYPEKSPSNTPPKHSTSTARYPWFEIYAPVYPHVSPYPQMSLPIQPPVVESMGKLAVQIAAVVNYPHFDLNPALVPVEQELLTERCLPVILSVYPVFNLYPAVYPDFDIYPSIHQKELHNEPSVERKDMVSDEQLSTRLAVSYPYFDLYPAIYPAFEIYPALPGQVTTGSRLSPVSMKTFEEATQYPTFNLYPSVESEPQIKETISTNASPSIQSGYPWFILYKPVYPHFDLYPPVAGKVPTMDTRVSLGEQSGYPFFVLYPPVYPHFNLYPSIGGEVVTKTAPVVIECVSQYPTFQLYASVYPHFDLYPPKAGRVVGLTKEVIVAVKSQYPTFQLYEPVYPHFDLYPSVAGLMESRKVVIVETVSQYPSFELYAPVYPHFNLYPLVAGETRKQEGGDGSFDGVDSTKQLSVRRDSGYPWFVLYPAVYPYFDLYPSFGGAVEEPRRPRMTHAELHAITTTTAELDDDEPKRPSRTHRQLHQSVFPLGLVSTPSGTELEHLRSLAAVSPERIESISRFLSESEEPRLQHHARTASSPTHHQHQRQGSGPSPLSHRAQGSLSPERSRLLSSPDTPHRGAVVSQRASMLGAPLRTTTTPPRPMESEVGRLRKISSSSSTTSSPLNRPSSLALPSRPPIGDQQQASLERSHSAASHSSKPPLRKRDSLVLQRVKALNSVGEESGSSLSMDALSQFPMPPRPVPSIPKALDRSRYTFGS